MVERVYELKSREYGEILDATFDLYKEHFLLLVSLTGVVYIPLAILQALGQLSRDPLAVSLVEGIAFLVGLFVALFVSGAMAKAVSDVYLGKEATFGESYGYVLRRWRPYLWTNLLVFVLTLLGLMACAIPGIVIGIYLIFATQVFVIEGRAGWAAVTRSHELVTGYWWRTLALLLLIGIIAGVLQILPLIAIGVVLKGTPLEQLLSTVWRGLANTVVAPLEAIMVILMYYDIRIRKEAFDLEVLADNMAESGAGAGPATNPTAAPAVSQQTVPSGGGTEGPAEERLCPGCGHLLTPGAAFCQQCGRTVGNPAP